jgi:hypothetical protein
MMSILCFKLKNNISIDQVSQQRHSRGVLTAQDKIRTETKANIGVWNEIVRILKIKWGKREKSMCYKSKETSASRNE